MDCIALYDSGNYAYRICRIFEQRGLVFQVISTPCKVSKTGCGYCLLFPEQYMNQVISTSAAYGCPVREVYRIEYVNDRKKYVKLL
ncbi:MAG TPA: DUF3343 domain-containing protein [Clostridiaceae bacterium]|nr:DUF3343 domain-containing protein [Clostridiaceae bacterium]